MSKSKKLAKASGALSERERSTSEDSKTLKFHMRPGETEAQAFARLSVDPVPKSAIAALNLKNPAINGGPSLNDLVEGLTEAVKRTKSGDMSCADEMLVSQAYALDNLFHVLLTRSAMQLGHSLEATETYMRLALKAQSQARTTWESLSKIKNPVGATFIRQANLANGPQQVNNHGQGSDVREIESQPNELKGLDGHAMDSGAAGAAVEGDPQVGTVEKRHRAENGGG